jgi:hypothetical protein
LEKVSLRKYICISRRHSYAYRRLLIFISLAILTPVGLSTKIYTGFGREWVNNYAGDILYEIFWCLLVFWFIPKQKAIVTIPLRVLAITCAIEVFQLWYAPIPISIRSSLIWKLLLGTSFSWWDFPHYLLGCLLGWLWLSLIWYGTKTAKINYSGK